MFIFSSTAWLGAQKQGGLGRESFLWDDGTTWGSFLPAWFSREGDIQTINVKDTNIFYKYDLRRGQARELHHNWSVWEVGRLALQHVLALSL